MSLLKRCEMRVAISAILCFLGVVGVAGQACSPTKTNWPDAPQVATWAAVYFQIQPLLSTTCASELNELAVCNTELSVQTGCCDATCTAAIKKVSSKCLQDYTCRIATSTQYSNLLKFQQALNDRCLGAEVSTASCSNATSTPSPAPTAQPAVECTEDPNTYPLVATNATGNCTTTAFKDVTMATLIDLVPVAANAPVACWDYLRNMSSTCEQDLLVKSGCCSAPCAQAVKRLPAQCVDYAVNGSCTLLGPAKPATKAFFNLAKRCSLGQVPTCPISNNTYPLQIYDTCDCPVKESNWTDFSVSNIAELVPILKGNVSDSCFQQATANLPICTADLQKSNGCCSSACWGALNAPTVKECYTQYLGAVCKWSQGAKYARSFIATAQRCVSDKTFAPACPAAVASPAPNNTAAGQSPAPAKSAAPAAHIPAESLVAGLLGSWLAWSLLG